MRVFSSCAAGVSVVPSAKSTSESQMTITDSLFGVCGSYTHTYLCLSSLASHWADSRRTCTINWQYMDVCFCSLARLPHVGTRTTESYGDKELPLCT